MKHEPNINLQSLANTSMITQLVKHMGSHQSALAKVEQLVQQSASGSSNPSDPVIDPTTGSASSMVVTNEDPPTHTLPANVT
jgi:hypothetical protein